MLVFLSVLLSTHLERILVQRNANSSLYRVIGGHGTMDLPKADIIGVKET